MVILTPAYIIISIFALLIIAAMVFLSKNGKKKSSLSQLAGLSFVFIIAGIFFSDDMLIGYSLIAIGIILALMDIVMKSKKKQIPVD